MIRYKTICSKCHHFTKFCRCPLTAEEERKRNEEWFTQENGGITDGEHPDLLNFILAWLFLAALFTTFFMKGCGT